MREAVRIDAHGYVATGQGARTPHLLSDLLTAATGSAQQHNHTPGPAPVGPTIDVAQFGGALPPARVDVVVPMSVLLGASDEPGMLTCGDTQEWLAARYLRDIAFTTGSTWRRLVTDPTTGHLRDLTVKGYAITGELRERILARDRISRAPGRVRPARWCDTDHDVDYARGGPSSESNVSAKDRRGHNHKTRRTWRSERDPGVDGDILWTTPTGRTYATTPWDHHDPDPPTPEHLHATFEKNRAELQAARPHHEHTDTAHPDDTRPHDARRDTTRRDAARCDNPGPDTTRREIDGLFDADRDGPFVHHLRLLINDHEHANDIIDRAQQLEPPPGPHGYDGGGNTLPHRPHRRDRSTPPPPDTAPGPGAAKERPRRGLTPWERKDPGPPPF